MEEAAYAEAMTRDEDKLVNDLTCVSIGQTLW